MSAMRSRARDRRIDVWLIHGLGDSPRVWRGVRKPLARKGHNVIAPALPGFGGTSPLPARRQGLEGLARWLEGEIRRRSGHRQVVVVGHSMGGMIGTLVASRMPELHGLVNIEGPLTLADCFTSRRAAEAKDFQRWFHAFRRDMRLPSSGAPKHYSASVGEADATSFRAGAKGIVALARRSRMGKLYAGLRVPCIFFYGVGPGGMSKRSRALLKAHGCETEEFAAAAHWPMTEAPVEFIKMLVRSVKRFL